MEVEHVKAHTMKEKKEMSHFEKFITEGNEKASELAKAGAMMDEGFVAEARVATVKQERERRCTQRCSVRLASVAWWRNGRTVRSSSRSRQKSGLLWTRKERKRERGSQQASMCEMWKRKQIHEDARKLHPDHHSCHFGGKMGKGRRLGGHDLVRRMDRQGEVLIWCRTCSGYARQRVGPQLRNCRKREQMGTKEYGKMLKRTQVLEDGRVPAKEARSWRIEGQKRRITRKEYQRLVNKFEM